MSTDYDYSEYERMCEEIRNKNKEYLAGFVEHLQEKGLKDKTIDNHVFNVDFYINSFLLRYDALEAKEGCHKVDGFLGDYFIRKAMWSTANSIKQNITSFKKFYSYLLSIGVIDVDDFESLTDTIYESKDEWINLVNRYNNPNEPNPFLMFEL